MKINIFRLIDSVFDKAAQRLAENMSSNVETVVQNKAARELSELSDEQLRQRGLERKKLEQGSRAYPWVSSLSSVSKEEVEKSLLQLTAQVHPHKLHKPQQAQEKTIFAA